jgi:hypothetical protein
MSVRLQWWEKRWYFCKYGGGCGDDVGYSYKIIDEFEYLVGRLPSTKGVAWGIRIF